VTRHDEITTVIRLGPDCPACKGARSVNAATVEELCAIHMEQVGLEMERRGASTRWEHPDLRP